MKRILLIVFLCFPLLAHAMTGNELYRLMNSSNKFENMRALQYTDTMREGLSYLIQSEKIIADYEQRAPNLSLQVCIPNDVSTSQAHDVIKKYLSDHPDIRNYVAWQFAHVALLETWPCVNK